MKKIILLTAVGVLTLSSCSKSVAPVKGTEIKKCYYSNGVVAENKKAVCLQGLDEGFIYGRGISEYRNKSIAYQDAETKARADLFSKMKGRIIKLVSSDEFADLQSSGDELKEIEKSAISLWNESQLDVSYDLSHDSAIRIPEIDNGLDNITYVLVSMSKKGADVFVEKKLKKIAASKKDLDERAKIIHQRLNPSKK